MRSVDHQEKSTGPDSYSYSYSNNNNNNNPPLYDGSPYESEFECIDDSDLESKFGHGPVTRHMLLPFLRRQRRNPSNTATVNFTKWTNPMPVQYSVTLAVILFFLLLMQFFPISPNSVLKNIDINESDEWNLFYHLGGNGPWIPRVDDIVEGGIDPPAGCKIDMIHMMSRHGERYPTEGAGDRMIKLVDRIKSSGKELKGSLAFLNNWEFFAHTPQQDFEQLTTTGPYAGTLEAFSTGVKLRTRYHNLWHDTTTSHPPPPPTVFWASDAERVINTAKYFGAGFFGLDYEQTGKAKLEIVSEDEEKGGNTLTPGDTCTKYREDEENGHNLGEKKLSEYRSTYLPAISQRLEKENPGFQFTDLEIYSMQEMCGFETLVRGSSPWCDIFTHPEWLQFEYARDIIHYFRTGPGNPYGMALGWLWLNATANLLYAGPDHPASGPIFLSFAHDGDIIPMLASLGLFEDSETLPLDRIYHERKWKTSQIVPMGGRVILERMVCSKESVPENPDGQDGVFIRFNVNDGIVALDGCNPGPGKSCPLDRFMQHVKKRGELGGDFRKVCRLPEWAPDRPTFLRQPGRGTHV